MKTFLLSVVACGLLIACKEKSSNARLNIPINQKIAALVKDAAAAGDENKKAGLYGEASELLIEKGDYHEAMRVARLGERANPTQKQCLASIAEVYISEGKLAEAGAVLKDLMQRNSGYGRALFIKGNLSASQSDYTGALASYAQAEKAKFEDPRLLLNMGAIGLRAKKLGDALKSYEKAIAKDADRAEGYLGAGIAARLLNKKADAKKYFEKYLSLAPGSAEADRVKLWLK